MGLLFRTERARLLSGSLVKNSSAIMTSEYHKVWGPNLARVEAIMSLGGFELPSFSDNFQ